MANKLKLNEKNELRNWQVVNLWNIKINQTIATQFGLACDSPDKISWRKMCLALISF
jgi:hypothetical protein